MTTLPPLTLGLVGEPLTGKDTLAAYLVERHGFVHVSTADFIRFYILENNLGEPTRPLMKEVSNFLRTEHGPAYLADLALRNDSPHLIISGMRNPHEVEAIKTAGGVIISLTSALETRYQRAKDRGRPGDNISLDEFNSQQAAEETSTNPNAQNMVGVLAMADVTLANDHGREALLRDVEKLLIGLPPR